MVDSMILMYNEHERYFADYGMGCLSDAISCVVTEELNGEFELVMEYPITGIHYSEIALRNLLYVNTSTYKDKQPFRIYSISKPIRGVVEICAQHISYDLCDIPIMPFSKTGEEGSDPKVDSPNEIFVMIQSAYEQFYESSNYPFVLATDFESGDSVSMSSSAVVTARSLMGGSDNSLDSLFHREWEFTYDTSTGTYGCNLVTLRGNASKIMDETDPSLVEIRYGKNMTDVTQDESTSNLYSHVFPYYMDGDSIVKASPELIPTYEEGHEPSYRRIMSLDISEYFSEVPSPSDIEEATKKYIEINNIGLPTSKITVSFAQLGQSQEYKQFEVLENVDIGDLVRVVYTDLGVVSSSRCIKIEYNVLTMKYKNVTLGDVTGTLASTIAAVVDDVGYASSSSTFKSRIYKEMQNTAGKILGSKGGYVKIDNSDTPNNPSAKPDRILIMDHENIEDAENVWIWNKQGLAHFNNFATDYTKEIPPANIAISQDGVINANFINTGTLNADYVAVENIDGRNIKSGTITAEQLQVSSSSTNLVTNSVGTNYVASSNGVMSENSIYNWKWYRNSSIAEEPQIDVYQNAKTRTSVYSESERLMFDKLALGCVSNSFIMVKQSQMLYTNITGIQSEYFISFKYASYTNASSGSHSIKVHLYLGEFDPTSTPSYLQTWELKAGSSSDDISWVKETLVFDNPYRGNIYFVIESDASTFAIVTDLIITQGSFASSWNSSDRELYNNIVKIDDTGINVSKEGSDTRTVINNEEFAVYSDNVKRITVNQDSTMLRKTKLLEEIIFSNEQGGTINDTFIMRSTTDGLAMYVF